MTELQIASRYAMGLFRATTSEKELQDHKRFFDSLGGVVPEELQKQREAVAARFK